MKRFFCVFSKSRFRRNVGVLGACFTMLFGRMLCILYGPSDAPTAPLYESNHVMWGSVREAILDVGSAPFRAR